MKTKIIATFFCALMAISTAMAQTQVQVNTWTPKDIKTLPGCKNPMPMLLPDGVSAQVCADTLVKKLTNNADAAATSAVKKELDRRESDRQVKELNYAMEYFNKATMARLDKEMEPKEAPKTNLGVLRLMIALACIATAVSMFLIGNLMRR